MYVTIYIFSFVFALHAFVQIIRWFVVWWRI